MEASNKQNELPKVLIGANSAFQPYKKQPDPFVSAPFEHNPPLNRKVSLSSASTSSSVTPTALSNSSTLTKIKQQNLEDLSEYETKNDEIIQVISNKVQNILTPNKIKKPKSINPFADAPFTVKRSNKKTNHSDLKKSINTDLSPSSDLNKTPIMFNQNLYALNQLSYPTDKSQDNLSAKKIPLSQSLNEIKSSAVASHVLIEDMFMSNLTPVIKNSSKNLNKNESINSIPSKKFTDANPDKRNLKQTSAGGISNMSFDDY